MNNSLTTHTGIFVFATPVVSGSLGWNSSAGSNAPSDENSAAGTAPVGTIHDCFDPIDRAKTKSRQKWRLTGAHLCRINSI